MDIGAEEESSERDIEVYPNPGRVAPYAGDQLGEVVEVVEVAPYTGKKIVEVVEVVEVAPYTDKKLGEVVEVVEVAPYAGNKLGEMPAGTFLGFRLLWGQCRAL